jgi:hypothetical protein
MRDLEGLKTWKLEDSKLETPERPGFKSSIATFSRFRPESVQFFARHAR